MMAANRISAQTIRMSVMSSPLVADATRRGSEDFGKEDRGHDWMHAQQTYRQSGWRPLAQCPGTGAVVSFNEYEKRSFVSTRYSRYCRPKINLRQRRQSPVNCTESTTVETGQESLPAGDSFVSEGICGDPESRNVR